jgi:hypothetical protein
MEQLRSAALKAAGEEAELSPEAVLQCGDEAERLLGAVLQCKAGTEQSEQHDLLTFLLLFSKEYFTFQKILFKKFSQVPKNILSIRL